MIDPIPFGDAHVVDPRRLVAARPDTEARPTREHEKWCGSKDGWIVDPAINHHRIALAPELLHQVAVAAKGMALEHQYPADKWIPLEHGRGSRRREDIHFSTRQGGGDVANERRRH